MIYSLEDLTPKIDDTCFIASNAQIIGNVVLAERVSVWFDAVLRADLNVIKVGRLTNIQDGCILHEDKEFPLIIGERVTVGHKVILHGCTVGDGCLIGMGSTVLNGAEIGEGSLVGAGSVVTPGKIIPPRSLVLGAPAKVVRELSDEEVENLQEMVKVYDGLRQKYLQKLKSI